MVDLTLERQPDVTDEMQDAAWRAYELAYAELKKDQPEKERVPSLWGWPLSCAIQAALNVKAGKKD